MLPMDHGAGSGGVGGRGGGGGGGCSGSSWSIPTGGRGGPGIVYIYTAPRMDVAVAQTQSAVDSARSGRLPGEAFAQFAGKLTPAEIMECDALYEESFVYVGIMRAGLCIDSAVFGDLATAEAFLADGVWPEADAVLHLPDACGVGDRFGGGIWTKQVFEGQGEEGQMTESGASLEAL